MRTVKHYLHLNPTSHKSDYQRFLGMVSCPDSKEKGRKKRKKNQKMNALMRATRTTPIPKPNVLQVKYQHFLDSTSTNSKENKSLDAA